MSGAASQVQVSVKWTSVALGAMVALEAKLVVKLVETSPSGYVTRTVVTVPPMKALSWTGAVKVSVTGSNASKTHPVQAVVGLTEELVEIGIGEEEFVKLDTLDEAVDEIKELEFVDKERLEDGEEIEEELKLLDELDIETTV